ncbi:MAG: thioesterase family protein, partial [Planctomycetota bacterium]
MPDARLPLPDDPRANTIRHRVYYAETDRMGWVYYGNYPAWFERGRTELLREIGLPYRSVEEGGLFLPVRSCEIRYHRPARYDDLVTFVTVMTRVRTASVAFLTVIYNEANELLAEGRVVLACVNAD